MKRKKENKLLPDGIRPDDVRKQLEEIFNSRDFVASRRLRDFLSYVVEQTLAGAGKDIKAYNIAVEVFGLEASFDPISNPLVRTEAARLRAKLEHYYLLNPAEAIHISIPKGGYAPLFELLGSGNESAPDVPSLSVSARSGFEPQASVVVFPFINSSNSDLGESIVSGLASEVITMLTRFSGLAVSAHPGAPSPGYDEAEQYGASSSRFFLSGRIQTSGDKFKLWSSLSDACTGTIIWAESFEGSCSDDLFEVQTAIAEKISNQTAAEFGLIQRRLIQEMQSGLALPSISQKAALLYSKWNKSLAVDDFRLALAALQESMKEEPGNAMAMAMLSDLYASNYQMHYEIEGNLEQSLKLAVEAARAEPDCQLAHLALCMNYYLRGEKNKFLISADNALHINPASSSAMAILSFEYGMLGLWDQALELAKKLFHLNPVAPGWCRAVLSFYHFQREDFEKAFYEAQKINTPQLLTDPLFRLISSVHLGIKAEQELPRADLLELHPNFQDEWPDLLHRVIPTPQYTDLIKNSLKMADIAVN
ncbi:MAG: hypothetical protein IJD04_01000 [Desulfovibrionaceae bacterium]|nr:hypothetical protein [Desulfovibrionaceae bacterium]